MKQLLLFIILFLNNSCYSQKVDTIINPVLYLYVDEMPKYEGGTKKLKEFIDHNIKWPGEFDGQGTVLTSFVVTKGGKISNINPDYAVDNSFCGSNRLIFSNNPSM